MISQDATIGDIAIEHPGATAVFRRYKIDFCGDGGASLSQAALQRGLSVLELQTELNGLATGHGALPTDPDGLIAHIISRYHEVHMAELPEALRLARRVEAVHRAKSDCPHGLADHLAEVFDELQGHQHKEEAVLFPMMLQGGAPMIRFPIERMLAEHVDVSEQLDELARLTTDFTPPQGACTTWRALYEMCRKLDEDLREHMHIENNILFPKFI
ncbi:MAG: DUF542 domain-containing protein [Alphaproteobacteria bacterium]|jgi:regulator of cell morphogenesis and NO signaling|nr:DUF542 domain-containing protein [Alphaproteobacteria bacterium]MBW0152272.1 DUF542 domain-containing protein [Phenylobacterium sp.]